MMLISKKLAGAREKSNLESKLFFKNLFWLGI